MERVYYPTYRQVNESKCQTSVSKWQFLLKFELKVSVKHRKYIKMVLSMSSLLNHQAHTVIYLYGCE